MLGFGSNGPVILAKQTKSSQEYAVTKVKLYGATREALVLIKQELKILLDADHPNIVRVADVYEGFTSLKIVTERLSGGDLLSHLSSTSHFSEQDAAEASGQMCYAVAYLHTKKVTHSNLKPSSFLYETPEKQFLKLCNLGQGKLFKPNVNICRCKGSLPYIAPEVLEGEYDCQCDMWSLGVITFLLLGGQVPTAHLTPDGLQDIRSAGYQLKGDTWAFVSTTAKDFVSQLLRYSPSDRLTAEQATRHAWIEHRRSISKKAAEFPEMMLGSLTLFGQASAFRRVCLNAMAWSLSNEERAKVREAFFGIRFERYRGHNNARIQAGDE